MDEKILDLLIYSLDNELTDTQQKMLDEALQNSEALRQEQARLLHMRKELAAFSAAPDATFSSNVLQVLEQPQSFNIVQLFPKVAAASVLLFIGSLLAIYFSEGNLSMEAIVGVQDLTPEDAYSYLGSE